jgi:hypothetical protein
MVLPEERRELANKIRFEGKQLSINPVSRIEGQGDAIFSLICLLSLVKCSKGARWAGTTQMARKRTARIHRIRRTAGLLLPRGDGGGTGFEVENLLALGSTPEKRRQVFSSAVGASTTSRPSRTGFATWSARRGRHGDRVARERPTTRPKGQSFSSFSPGGARAGVPQVVRIAASAGSSPICPDSAFCGTLREPCTDPAS